MRSFIKTAARALHDRRELAVAAATAIVAAALIVSGQGNLAAVVTMGTAGFMAGRARQYRLAAQELRRQVTKLGDELSDNEMNVSLLSQVAREREEDLAFIERQMRLSLNDSRKAITEYKSLLRKEEEAAPSRTSFLFSEVMRDWSRELDALETVINNISQELVGEQTQLADLLPPEDVEKFYSNENEKEVNANDTAAEE